MGEQLRLFGGRPVYLMSIRQESAEALLDGSKPHEFRRRFPHYEGEISVFLYVVRPVKEVVAHVVFGPPITNNPEALCALLEGNGFDTEQTLRRYLRGCEQAYALPVVATKRLSETVPLQKLKSLCTGFNPPVSAMRLEQARYATMREHLERLCEE